MFAGSPREWTLLREHSIGSYQTFPYGGITYTGAYNHHHHHCHHSGVSEKNIIQMNDREIEGGLTLKGQTSMHALIYDCFISWAIK